METGFVTRIKDNVIYKEEEELYIDKCIHSGVISDQITMQIYCVLIVNLLLTIVQKQLKRPWAFSNPVSFCRIHLFNYIHLLRFLENPEKDWQKSSLNIEQLALFDG